MVAKEASPLTRDFVVAGNIHFMVHSLDCSGWAFLKIGMSACIWDARFEFSKSVENQPRTETFGHAEYHNCRNP